MEHVNRYRWKVFANIRLIGSKSHKKSLFLKSSKKIHLILALVHTGINMGVVSLTPFNSISPTLAFHFCFSILKLSLDMSEINN